MLRRCYGDLARSIWARGSFQALVRGTPVLYYRYFARGHSLGRVQLFSTKSDTVILDTVQRDTESSSPKLGSDQPAEPELLALQYTCNKCGTKAVKRFTYHSYTKGVVLLRCDTCKSLHLVADNLGWFDDHEKQRVVPIEQIIRNCDAERHH